MVVPNYTEQRRYPAKLGLGIKRGKKR